jgi:hypothetical protein
MKWRIWGLRSNGTENRYKGLDDQNSIQNSSFRVHAAFRETTNHQNGVIVDRHVISCNILSLSNVRNRVLIKPVFCSIAPQTQRSRNPIDPIPYGPEIFVIEGQTSNVVIKIDSLLQSCFGLLHVARDTGVAGEIELDKHIVVMQFTRSHKDLFCLLNALTATRRIRETYPPANFFGLDLHQMTRYCGCHVPFLGRHVEINASAQDLLPCLVFRPNLFERVRRIIKHSQLSISAGGKDMFLPIGFQGIAKRAFVVAHVTSRNAPAVTASIKNEPK